MQQLPICDYRVTTEEQDTFFCRHTRVRSSRSLVNPTICQMCEWRSVPCSKPRRVPDDPLADVPPAPVVEFPSVAQRVWDLAGSLRSFVADGLKTVTKEDYAIRLEICESCDQRRGNWCRQCGCFLTLKATGRAFRCPLSKWPDDASHGNET